MKSKVRAAKSWNFLTSSFWIPMAAIGDKIANTQSEIGLVEKAKKERGQGEHLQRILAKWHSKKIWERVSKGPLQKGHNHASGSSETTKRPILALEGKTSQATFHKRCFNLACNLRPQRKNQASVERVDKNYVLKVRTRTVNFMIFNQMSQPLS